MPASRERDQALRALQSGQLDVAQSQIQTALSHLPSDVESLVVAAMVESQRQDFQAAEQYLQRALEIDASHLEALIVLSKLLDATHRPDQAISVSEAAVRHYPRDADLWLHLAQQLSKSGEIVKAAIAFGKSAELNPARKGDYANALLAAGREAEAIQIFKELTALAPQNLNLRIATARLLLLHGRFAESIELTQEALALDSVNQPANLLMALALAEDARGAEAYPYLRRAVKLNPKDGLAKAALGFWYQEEGRFDESVAMLEDAIQLVPNHGFAYYNLLRARKASEVDPSLWADLHQRVKRDNLHLRDRTYLNYALGKGHEDLGEIERAINYYDAGNRDAHELWLGANPWQRDAYQAHFTQTIETFDRAAMDRIAGDGLDSAKPLIIVGMMRSGTSLVEQILSSHPDILGAGELSFWHDHEADAFTEGLPDPEKIRALGERYLEDLNRIGPDSRRVTDKLPHNYAMLGLIHSAFPNAKIIHLRRNPVDNCLSIYTTAYQRPPIFAHNRENIVFAYREYQRIMNHWRSVLQPNQLLEIDYEELIADRESATRRLIEFSGLDWSDACLSHESNRRAVRTPSLWQVRQPIYKTSIERWRRFEPWIPEFVALQNP